MANQNPFGVEQGAVYVSSVTGGATPAAANLIGTYRGDFGFQITQAHAEWRGQDRVPSFGIVHDTDVAMSVPGFSWDSSAAFVKLMNGVTSATTTSHGASWTGTRNVFSKNTKPLMLEVLFEGINSDDGKRFQVLCHRGFITGESINFPRGDFSATDLNFILLADSNGRVISTFDANTLGA